MTHSLSTDVYTSEGLFDFTSDPAVEALMLMKKIMALANPEKVTSAPARKAIERLVRNYARPADFFVSVVPGLRTASTSRWMP